ncbi:MAG TPA: helicase-related protein, partial [Planctomycetota bacterium]|nr:helicase-related protein [Planctomycetota bacterium]
LEPRRIAARLAARRVAEERGEKVGETIGYQVRFEDVSSKATRLRFLTEGILARRLARDPTLRGVSTVVLDEFHERHIHGDLALALVAELRRTRRPDLRVVVMSATLDAGPVATFLGDARGEAPVVDEKGRVFEVAIEFAGMEAREPLEERVAGAVERVIENENENENERRDILVFLPGAGEIAAAERACAAIAKRRGLVVLPLHGSLPPEEQDRALRPAAGRKVILATNVAETSVTIDGVAVVIDSGLARVASHSPWSGLPTLKVEPVSRASAAQRAGRAGRTRPGRCLRLYTRRDFDMRPPFTAPEVERIDLAETLLTLAAAGVRDPARFRWFEAPPASALEGARTLLRRLGATAADGALTPTGERILRFPLHPRLARVHVAAEDLGVGPEAAAVAALLSDDRRRLAHLDDREARRRTEPARRQLERLLKKASHPMPHCPSTLSKTEQGHKLDRESALDMALLAGHPDRVARRRKPGSEELLLFEGGTATLARESDVPPDAEWLVALDAEERLRGPALVRLAGPIEPDWILDLFADEVREVV